MMDAIGQSDARRFEQAGQAGSGMRPPADGARADGAESVGGLISGLIKDIQDLVRGEMRLAKAELKEDASTIGRGAAFLAAGALLGVIALVFLGLAAAALLDKWMQTWIAVAIVMAVFALLAAILALSGKNQLSASNLKPEQTIESLKEDQEWAKQQINSVKR